MQFERETVFYMLASAHAYLMACEELNHIKVSDSLDLPSRYFPIMYCLGMSLELFAKSALMVMKFDKNQVKKLNHNLGKIFRELEGSGLIFMNEYKEDLIKIVETISQDYLDHSYRYGPVRSDLKIITGIKRNTNCVRSFGLHVQHLYEDKIRTLDKLDL